MAEPLDDTYLDAAVDDTYIDADQLTGNHADITTRVQEIAGCLDGLVDLATTNRPAPDLYLAAIDLAAHAAAFAADLHRNETATAA